MDVSDGEAKEVGFVAILSKPILIEELARTLVRYAKTSDQEPPVV
jgi:CheY-like chemotaxis protein